MRINLIKFPIPSICNIDRGFPGLPTIDRALNKDIIIKIGVHKGTSIAVTLNDRLDYFGQTVNVAARVQGLADAEEIYITDSVYDTEGIQNEISDYTVILERAKLRGIQEEMDVYKVLVENVQPSMSI